MIPEGQYGLMSCRITDEARYYKMQRPLHFNAPIHLSHCRERLPSGTVKLKLYAEGQRTPSVRIAEA
jgi:hypothetical protein